MLTALNKCQNLGSCTGSAMRNMPTEGRETARRLTRSQVIHDSYLVSKFLNKRSNLLSKYHQSDHSLGLLTIIFDQLIWVSKPLNISVPKCKSLTACSKSWDFLLFSLKGRKREKKQRKKKSQMKGKRQDT